MFSTMPSTRQWTCLLLLTVGMSLNSVRSESSNAMSTATITKSGPLSSKPTTEVTESAFSKSSTIVFEHNTKRIIILISVVIILLAIIAVFAFILFKFSIDSTTLNGTSNGNSNSGVTTNSTRKSKTSKGSKPSGSKAPGSKVGSSKV